MYTKAAEECLKNAKQLFSDAELLFWTHQSFGPAQSLCVTALEETAKAIILEFANLNCVGKRVVKQAMRHHIPKQVIISAFEKGILFVEHLDREKGDYEIDMGKINDLREKLFRDIGFLKDKRVNGLYVKIKPKDGSIIKSPFTVSGEDVRDFLYKTRRLLDEGVTFCQVSKEFRTGATEGEWRNNLQGFVDKYGNFSYAYDEA
jgi:AbiV family abortive infection protein